MSEIKEMFCDHFTMDANNLPLDMFRQLDDPYPDCIIEVHFSEDFNDHNALTLDGAWAGEQELEISHLNAIDLVGMIGAYDDIQRQDIAEGGF